MRVVEPIVIDDTNLTYSNVPEDEYDQWSSVPNYSLADRVIRNHKIYESVLDGSNHNVDPESDDNDPPSHWLFISYTNLYRSIDLLRNTQTTLSDHIEYQITPNSRIDTVGLVNLECDYATVRVEYGGDVVYERELVGNLRTTSTWSEYFFGEFDFKRAMVFDEIPPFAGADIFIDVYRTGGDASIGGIVLGTGRYIGEMEVKATSDALNFSVVERNEFGDSTLIPRRSIPKTNQTLFLPKNLVNKAISVREKLNAVPALWIGLDDNDDGYFNSFLILGYYRQFLINAEYNEYALIQLELEEI